jgi:hypothetical protein
MITADQYEEQRKRRFGTANPERMSVPTWEWMVRRGIQPHVAQTELRVGSHVDPNPDWTFVRTGMSRTRMPDGRVICIAGEHEDYYDPDFCIYNDVIVLRAAAEEAGVTLESGSVELYGYPESVFPPTDFHSATLVGDRLYIIGRLGYQGAREFGRTPVLVLDTATFRVQEIRTRGTAPGWIWRHHAAHDPVSNSIVVRAGFVAQSEAEAKAPSFAAYRLRLDDFSWELLSPHERHRTFTINQKGWTPEATEPTAAMFRTTLVPSDALFPEDRGIDVFAMSVEGVRITFEAWHRQVLGTIEGELRDETMKSVLEEVTQSLTRGTGTEWELVGPD